MSRFARTLAFVGVFALVFVPACGGGGGGDDGGPSSPVVLRDVYDFTITDTESSESFGVAFTEDTGDHKIVVSHGTSTVAGSYHTRTHQWTFDAGSEWEIDTNQGDDMLFGTFTLAVDTELVIPDDAPPTAGALTVDAGAFEASVEIVAGGVEVSIDGGDPDFYSWSDFEDLADDDTASLQARIASFAFQALRFLIERYDQVVALIYQLLDVSDLEEGFNPRDTTCVSWPDGYTLVPDTLENPGFSSILWNDRDFSEGVNTGDDFTWQYGNCRPHSDADGMYSGAALFQNLVESVDASNTVLEAGFRPLGGRDGGVFFGGLQILEMDVDDGAMTVTYDSSLELSGAFAFGFTAR